MERKVMLDSSISEGVFQLVGEFIILFGAIEWLIANTLLLVEIGSEDYVKIKDQKITQKYFRVLLSMPFGRKLEQLKIVGYDTSVLKAISNYRSALTHGLIFKQAVGLTIKEAARPEADHKELTVSKIKETLELLKAEGGKLVGFLEDTGHSFHPPM